MDLNAEEEDIENLEAFAKELVAKFNILAIKSHPDLFNLYGSFIHCIHGRVLRELKCIRCKKTNFSLF